MNKQFWVALFLSYVIIFPTQAASVPSSLISPLVKVVYLSVSKIDILPEKRGMTLVLQIHAQNRIFKFDPNQTQLQLLSDNLKTDLITASKQQVRVGEQGIHFALSNLSADGRDFLLTINSVATPTLGATQLYIKANLVLLALGNNTAEQVTEVNNVSVTNDTNRDGAKVMVNNQPFILSIYSREPHGDDQIIHYKINTPLAVTRVEAYDTEGTEKLGSVIILPGKENTLQLRRIIHLVKLKIYYQTAKVVNVPVDITTGLGI